MDDFVGSLSNTIEKIYQSFFLRDLLGFVIPGALSLFSLAHYSSQDRTLSFFENAEVLFDRLQESMPGDLAIIGFILLSYLTAWILQSVHYVMVDWVYAILRLPNVKLPKYRRVLFLKAVFWPLASICFYARNVAVGKQDSENEDSRAKMSPSLITKGALAPDEAFSSKATKGFPAEVRDRFSRYSDRLSALMLMTGNLAIAGVLFFAALWRSLGFMEKSLGCFVLLCIYAEYWRLWYTRNLQSELQLQMIIQISGSDSQS